MIEYALVITIAGVISYGPPIVVGRYDTIEQCKGAASAAIYASRNHYDKWRPYNDGAICIPVGKRP